MLLLNLYINILANSIIDRYYKDSRCLLIFSEESCGFSYQGNLPSVQIKIIDDAIDFEPVFHYFGCQGVILQSRNPAEVLARFEKAIRLNMERFSKRKFLILPTTGNSSLQQDIFLLKELDYISDLLVVFPDGAVNSQPPLLNFNSSIPEEQIIFLLKTHQYVGISDNNKPILLDCWFSSNRSFLHGRNLYPDKITNQQGRKLRMAAFTYEPYSIIGDSVESFKGSELSTAVHYAEKHNMTPVAVVNENDYWGDIFSNWSGNGLLGNLVDDNADIGFSALYTWEFCYHYLDLSKPLVRTGITCLVPAPKLAAGWLTPLFSYSTQMWISVAIVFLLGIATLSSTTFFYTHNKTMKDFYHIRRGKNFVNILGLSVLSIWKPFLVQSLTKEEVPKEFINKMIMTLMLVFSLFLSSTYSSGFSSIMTVPRYEDAIDTVEDFARSELDWGATQDAWIMSIQHAEEPLYKKIVSRFHPISERRLRENSKTGKFGFSIERLPFGNFAIGTYIKEDVIGDFHLMQEDLYWEQCLIMARKSSILLPSVDDFILRAFEAGLISRWQNEAVELYMDSKVQRAVKFYRIHSGEHAVVKLKWVHIEGAFAALAIGYCVSFAIFLFELVQHRTRKRKIFRKLKNKRLLIQLVDVSHEKNRNAINKK